jgi:hypothetical protein
MFAKGERPRKPWRNGDARRDGANALGLARCRECVAFPEGGETVPLTSGVTERSQRAAETLSTGGAELAAAATAADDDALDADEAESE